jgi:hypothetical protein
VRTRRTRCPLRLQFGQGIQRQRFLGRLTLSGTGGSCDLSLKYDGEIKHGEANTTLEVLELLADAVARDPMDASASLRTRDHFTEDVRQFLGCGVQQTFGRLAETDR